jgi:hypothetical protein
MSLCTDKCHDSPIISTKCYAQSWLNEKWACPTHFSLFNFIDQRKGIIKKIWNVAMKKWIDHKWKFSENGHITILNAPKRREDIGSSHKKYSNGPWNLPIIWHENVKS